MGLRDTLDLRDELESCLLVGDGTMDTLLTGHGIAHPLDKAVLTHPHETGDLHEGYLHAGTRITGTNTYATNKIRPKSRNLLTEKAREDADSPGEEDAPKYGIEAARKLLGGANPLVDRGHLMPPASMSCLAEDMIEAIK